MLRVVPVSIASGYSIQFTHSKMSSTADKRFKGFVYFLAAESDPTGRIYIGSSTTTPKHRMQGHESSWATRTREKNPAAHEILRFEDAKMHVVEEYELEATNKTDALRELQEHEQFWIALHGGDCVNKRRASGKRSAEDDALIKFYCGALEEDYGHKKRLKKEKKFGPKRKYTKTSPH